MHLHNRSQTVKTALIALHFWIESSHAATCYWPNGSRADSLRSCPNSLSCCAENEACLSNGLCFGTDLGIIYRGGCTDNSWSLSNCSPACYKDITDSYANLFQCPGNGDWKNMTCSTSGDAESACGSGAVGSYTYVSGGYVTMAQAGGFISNSTCNSTNKNAGSNNVTDSTSSAQTPACSGSSHSSTVALGAGLGAGLGIPLLICTAVLVYCAASRRRKLPYSQQKPEDMNQSTAGRPAPPAELDEGTQRVEMGDKLVTRSELHGYDTPQF